MQPRGSIASPFLEKHSLSRGEVTKTLDTVVGCYKNTVDAVVFCAILGGKWEGDNYQSWKLLSRGDFKECLISGFLKEAKTIISINIMEVKATS